MPAKKSDAKSPSQLIDGRIKVNPPAFKALVKDAAALNATRKS